MQRGFNRASLHCQHQPLLDKSPFRGGMLVVSARAIVPIRGTGSRWLNWLAFQVHSRWRRVGINIHRVSAALHQDIFQERFEASVPAGPFIFTRARPSTGRITRRVGFGAARGGRAGVCGGVRCVL